jgi:endonuclease/exonuclease/phosphatase family metal-dependent hydrolase
MLKHYFSSLVLLVSVIVLLFQLDNTSANMDPNYYEGSVPWENSMSSDDLRIGSFNIQVFGKTKMSHPLVVKTLVKILSRYDIVFVQEIRDASGEAIQKLVADLEQSTGKTYEITLSERLGRTNSKESYAYISDRSKVEVLQSFQYPVALDQFERPPFSILIQNKPKRNQLWFLTGVHTSPSKAPEEINALFDVYNYYLNNPLVKTHIENNWIAMGDFNADCSYMPSKDWSTNRLFNDKRFKFLISSGEDTTVSANHCAYDRFVTTHLSNSWNPDVVIFHFDDAYGLTTDEAKKVSDHYPIEISINNWN